MMAAVKNAQDRQLEATSDLIERDAVILRFVGAKVEYVDEPITNRKDALGRREATGSNKPLLIEPIVDELATGWQPRSRIMRRSECEGDSMEEAILSGA